MPTTSPNCFMRFKFQIGVDSGTEVSQFLVPVTLLSAFFAGSMGVARFIHVTGVLK